MFQQFIDQRRAKNPIGNHVTPLVLVYRQIARSMASQPARATIASEFIHNEPFPVTANMLADAIMAAVAARHAHSNLTSSLFLVQAFK